jgi:hypothetical protein
VGIVTTGAGDGSGRAEGNLSSAAHDIIGLTQLGVDISNAADVGRMIEKPLEVVSREIGVGVDTR